MRLVFTYCLLLLSSFFSIKAQYIPQKGVPLLKGFTPAEYDHRGKIWDIDTAPNGMVYMASDKGLLEYDGDSWRHYSGSEGITRAVVVVSDSIIYTGSDLDFGVWKRNRYSEFEYTSLYPFKEDLSDINEEFWNVHVVDNTPFFISENNIYVYEDQNLTKIPAPNRILESFQLETQIYLFDEGDGFSRLVDLSPKKQFNFGDDVEFEIVGIFENNGELVFVTQNEGLLTYKNGELVPRNSEVTESLKEANVFSFEQINDSYLAFGTILNGLYITDMEGNLLHHINKSKGLQNNTILSIHYSPDNKLWLSMDYGISYIDLSDNFTVVYDNRGTFGTAYNAVLKDNLFYLGTNQGLYTASWNDLDNSNEYYDFDLVRGTEGQVWGLEVFEDDVWISHDRGLFALEYGTLKSVSDRRGVWTVEPYGEFLLAGTYNGISIFQKSGGEWDYLKQMELIAGSCNQVIVDDEGFLWVNIPNYGVIRSEINENLNPENREIFESNQFAGSEHFIEQTKEGVYVVSGNVRYQYLPNQGRFLESSNNVRESRIEDLLLRRGRSTMLNEKYEFFPVYNGFALKDLTIEQGKQDSNFQVVIRDVWAYNNNERENTYDGAEISYRFNNVKIQAIVPNQKQVEYQFWAETTDEWTEPSSNNTFELIGLEYGEHVVKAKATVDGISTNIATFSFEILAPWYRTWYAYVVYTVIVLASFYLLYLWLGISLDKQKKHLLNNQRESLKKQQERFQLQLKRVEEEKLRAEYKNLKAELKNKTIELATKAKENDEKNKVFKNLKEKFQKIEDNPASLKRKIGEIKKVIDANLNTEADNTFEIQIDELHQDFFEELRNEFPELTRYDLRLCAYIKIGFDSKEIADLLNIKPSSVYISRSRLRKKLDIETDKDLHSYLNTI